MSLNILSFQNSDGVSLNIHSFQNSDGVSLNIHSLQNSDGVSLNIHSLQNSDVLVNLWREEKYIRTLWVKEVDIMSLEFGEWVSDNMF